MKQIKKDLKRATQHVQAATNEKPFEHIQIATFLPHTIHGHSAP